MWWNIVVIGLVNRGFVLNGVEEQTDAWGCCCGMLGGVVGVVVVVGVLWLVL